MVGRHLFFVRWSIPLSLLVAVDVVHAQIPEATSGFRFPIDETHIGFDFLEDTGPVYRCGWVYHPGRDMNGPACCDNDPNTGNRDLGLPVHAAADGRAVYANESVWGGVVIEHLYKGETFYSQYGHVQAISVAVGHEVKKGQQIAEVGNVGAVSAHLHFEIRTSAHPDPIDGSYWQSCQDPSNTRYLVLQEFENLMSWYREPFAFIQTHGPYSPTEDSFPPPGTLTIRQITDFVDDPGLSGPAVSPDGSMVAFVEFTPGIAPQIDGQLFVADTHGESLTQISPRELIVSTAGSVGGRAVSFGDDRIAFLACFEQSSCFREDADLHVIRADGSGLIQLTEGERIRELSVRLSGDGSTVLFRKIPPGIIVRPDELFLIDSDGSNERQIPLPADVRILGASAINSDGSLIAFSYFDGISWKVALMVPDGSGFQVLADTGLSGVGDLALSGDGSTAVFAHANGGTRLLLVKTDGSDPFTLEPPQFGVGVGSPSANFTGSKVAYRYSTFSQSDIFAINSDGTHRTNLTNTPLGTDFLGSHVPAMSEDGSVVTFLSNADLDVGMNPDLTWEVFVGTLVPALRIDGSTVSAKQQGETFAFLAAGLTPAGPVTRHLRSPDGTELTLMPLLHADIEGKMGWTFTSDCDVPAGIYRLWLTDDNTGRISNIVTENILPNPLCGP
jgi:Tol biopolymer transport system component